MRILEEIRQGQYRQMRTFRIRLVMTAFLAASMVLSVWPGDFVRQKGQRGCTMVLVGKQATADGSVLMSYSNDWDGKGASHVVFVPRGQHKPGETTKLNNGAEIPQVEEAYAYIGNELQWTDDPTFENGINEHQVAICFGTAVEINPKAREADPLLEEKEKRPGLLIPWSLVLERAKTAREGVDLVEKLFNQYGLREDGSFAIADPNEIWVFQIGGRPPLGRDEGPGRQLCDLRQHVSYGRDQLRGQGQLQVFAGSRSIFHRKRPLRSGFRSLQLQKDLGAPLY